ncbi:MAG: undecaprenyldiphospho-muramoylpentapeptide beta-N-acetylglucosaminyltransferase [Clostridiales bacterium]|jgi:UDP-N-acetylglucosamine--N-acetylmuramyl-(pentapeptide) pyrophosphoryl-undecaprenol N-acetylglucosamine transferase|nr:undecaprenyldiphospho-muramoylpentapeptide beta-N-acetylglucosaminyltransferase [Clostridiales bacterium]
MKFLFTCGGTAGHINPALGVAQRLKELMPDCEILFVGAEGHMETELVPREGFPIKTVTITNISRSINMEGLKHNAKTVKNVFTSIAQAKVIIREFQPDVVIGTGGYVCYPVLKAAHSLDVPTAVHESNAVPGLTTKMLAGVTDKILVGFEESRQYYKHKERVVVTGTPVRQDFRNADKIAAREKLGLEPDKPLVVSVWGSLGAAFMNKTMVGFIGKALGNPFFGLIHSAGRGGYSKMLEDMEKAGLKNVKERGMDVREYIYDMPLVMAAADLVVCRSGASTLSELAVLGRPAILVPSPNVTNNHQEKNARVLEKAGAAVVIPESDITEDKLLGSVSLLLSRPDTLEAMAEQMKKIGVGDATEKIADIVLDLAKK